MENQSKKGFAPAFKEMMTFTTSEQSGEMVRVDTSSTAPTSTDSNPAWIVNNATPSKAPMLVYGGLALGAVGLFVYFFTTIMTVLGGLLALGAGAFVLTTLYFLYPAFKKWAYLKGIEAYKKVIEANPIPHLEMERNKAIKERKEVRDNIESLKIEARNNLHESRNASKLLKNCENQLKTLKSRLDEVKIEIENLKLVADYDLKIMSDLEKKRDTYINDIRLTLANAKRHNNDIVKFGMASKETNLIIDKFEKYAILHSNKVNEIDVAIKELKQDLKLNKRSLHLTEIVRRLEDVTKSGEFNWSLESAKTQVENTQAKLNSNINMLDEKLASNGQSISLEPEFIENELDDMLKGFEDGSIGQFNAERYMDKNGSVTSEEEFISKERAYNNLGRD